MTKGFCPKCGHFSFGYDPLTRIFRCYNARCGFIDVKKEYGEGLRENPFSYHLLNKVK